MKWPWLKGPMTKQQKHIVMDKRVWQYSKPELREYISKEYGIPYEEVDLAKLTKAQAQDIITSFKPKPLPKGKAKNYPKNKEFMAQYRQYEIDRQAAKKAEQGNNVEEKKDGE